MTTELYARDDVRRRLDLPETLGAVERTYAEAAEGRVLNPPKLGMDMGDDGEWPGLNAFSIDMPAYVGWLDVAGTKWAVATWNRPADPISSLVLLFDVERGAFTAVLEGMHVTGVRTALQSAVGARHLAATEPTAVGVFGAGFQARFQLRVLDDLIDVREFRVYDVDEQRAREFADGVDPQTDAEVRVAAEPATAAAADAVVTVTDARRPVLEEAWLDGEGLVVALGSYRELPDETILHADHLVVDHVDQCLQRGALADLAGRGELGAEDIDATIGAVLNGDYGETIRQDDRVLFVPIGLGALDVAIAEQVRNRNGDSAPVQTFDFG